MDREILRQYIGLMVERIRSKPPSTRWDVSKGGIGHVNKFNWQSFKTTKSLDDMRNYVSNRLESLGSGSAREVYVLSNKHVIKIAKNNAGLAQNEQEVSVYTNPKTKSIVTKIVDMDPEFRWISCETAKPCESEEDCKRILKDESMIDFSTMIDLASRGDFNEIEYWVKDPKILAFADAVFELTQNNNLLVGDLEKPDSWGQSPDGRLVLLDYGLSRGVWNNYY